MLMHNAIILLHCAILSLIIHYCNDVAANAKMLMHCALKYFQCIHIIQSQRKYWDIKYALSHKLFVSVYPLTKVYLTLTIDDVLIA